MGPTRIPRVVAPSVGISSPQLTVQCLANCYHSMFQHMLRRARIYSSSSLKIAGSHRSDLPSTAGATKACSGWRLCRQFRLKHCDSDHLYLYAGSSKEAKGKSDQYSIVSIKTPPSCLVTELGMPKWCKIIVNRYKCIEA